MLTKSFFERSWKIKKQRVVQPKNEEAMDLEDIKEASSTLEAKIGGGLELLDEYL